MERYFTACDYINHDVINRYCQDYNKTQEFARDVFKQLLKWLHISQLTQFQGSALVMSEAIAELDNMWHTFILFTKDYEEFCLTYYKCFIHHSPVTTETPKLTLDESKNFYRKYFTLIIEEFGESTLISWFKEKKYA
ncbi:MAG: hypothetical protein Q8R83_10165 [Legionellaceae bacterium]|nr:hypothetical protein [Legionellaceae bacterium]